MSPCWLMAGFKGLHLEKPHTVNTPHALFLFHSYLCFTLLLMITSTPNISELAGIIAASFQFSHSLCVFCSSAARKLQKDSKADRWWSPAVQWTGQLLPGEGKDRKKLCSAAKWLGQEVEGHGGERWGSNRHIIAKIKATSTQLLFI